VWPVWEFLVNAGDEVRMERRELEESVYDEDSYYRTSSSDVHNGNLLCSVAGQGLWTHAELLMKNPKYILHQNTGCDLNKDSLFKSSSLTRKWLQFGLEEVRPRVEDPGEQCIALIIPPR